jgi:UDP-2,3-diacylglucosamine pyrophosphatase LpxH
MITSIQEPRLLVVSDLHLGNRVFPEAHRQFGALLRFACDHGFSLCLNGDGVDIAQLSPGRLTRELVACRRYLGPLAASGLKVYYVVGNHDILFEHFLADWGGFITAPFLNVRSGDLRIRIAHGHLHDEMFLRFPRLYAAITVVGRWMISRSPALYERGEHALETGVKLVRRLTRPDSSAIRYPAGGIAGEHPSFRRAAEEVSLRGFDVVIFGHTHRAGRVELASGSTYYNTGAWLHRPRCVAIDHGRVWFGEVGDLLAGRAPLDALAPADPADATLPEPARSRTAWSHAS